MGVGGTASQQHKGEQYAAAHSTLPLCFLECHVTSPPHLHSSPIHGMPCMPLVSVTKTPSSHTELAGLLDCEAATLSQNKLLLPVISL